MSVHTTQTASIDAAAERLSAAYEAIIGDPARFAAYLTMVGRLRRYSPANCALIYWQYPEASAVASYAHWQREGRQVRKGARAIRIFAPLPIPVTDATGETERDADGVPKTRTGFKLVPVFDISQTTGPALPAIPEPTRPADPLTEEQCTAFAALLAAIAAEGIAYRVDASLPDQVAGMYCHDAREIVVNARMPEAARLKTTIHEYAHALAEHTEHQDGKASREAIAEGTAFVVCAALGLDTSTYSPAYIAGYSDTPDRLRESLIRIKSVADRILTRISESNPNPTELAPAPPANCMPSAA
jgi:hypothetical protein